MRRLFWSLTTLLLVLSAFPLALHGRAAAAEIHPGLALDLETLAPDDPVSIVLFMRDQAPIASLDATLKQERATRKERHRRVVVALQEASRSQADLLAYLADHESTGEVVGHTSYWIANMVVAQVTRDFVYELAARVDVAVIGPNLKAELITPVGDMLPGEPSRGIGVPPGLRAINADRVWYELGITGAGRVLANLDTGVDGNHPALASRWRGVNGHPASECWLDVLGGHPDFPYDGYGHGTHVLGTMTGLGETTEDSIGVAWGALWIACNAIDQGVSEEFENDVTEAFQWFADPDGNPETVDDVPDVVQNSWRVFEAFGYPNCDDTWWAVIDHCEAAGVVTTWSAGNEGSDPGTIGSPPDRATTLTNCFSIGAVDATNYSFPYPIAGFSSRGPTLCDVPDDRKIKPEVSAPGVDVYSSVPGGGYQQSGWSGTSMAGPHMAGIVALMREANPDLDVDLIKTIIMATAVDHGATGEDNDYGWGVVDAYEAVLAVIGGYGTLTGTITNSFDGSPIPGAVVDILELDRQTTSQADGTYTILLPEDTYTVSASHPSFAPATVYGVAVYEDLVTTQDFALDDIAAPVITNTTAHRSTDDTAGPYTIATDIFDFSLPFSWTLLKYRTNGGPFQAIGLSYAGGDTYTADIPGQPYTTYVEYYIDVADALDNAATDPPGAPAELYNFYVAPIVELLADDMESGAPGWTHYAVTGGFGDQWHLSTQRNYTPGGTTSWKCGDTGAGDYGNLLDAGLVTPPLDLGIDSYLHYWQWINSETSGSYPEYAYDGGLLEISVDGGPFMQIFPDGGYTHRVREGSTPGPFPAETEIFAGELDWHEVHCNLGAYAGTAQIRFRFGTDGADTREGWYVDDVVVDGFFVDMAAIPADESARLFLLQGADPNPFVSRTTLRYQIGASADVSLQVFDLGGRLVRTLVAGRQEPGLQLVDWDGLDDGARRLPSGVYLTRLQAGTSQATGKVILSR